MKIISFSFQKIEAERKKELRGKLEIKSNLQIEDIKKENVGVIGETLRFHYNYSIKYGPEFAEINFKGEVLIIPDNTEDFKKILKEWKKKKISEEIKLPIINFVMSKCNLKALQLEEELSLPPHIPFPQVTGQQPQTNYTG